MNPYMRKRIPYRGEPVPDYPKPKKRVRNLRQEKITRFLILGICISIMIALLVIIASSLPMNSSDYTVAFVTGFAALFFYVLPSQSQMV